MAEAGEGMLGHDDDADDNNADRKKRGTLLRLILISSISPYCFVLQERAVTSNHHLCTHQASLQKHHKGAVVQLEGLLRERNAVVRGTLSQQ